MTVENFTGTTTAHEPAEQLLEKAKTWGCEDVIIIGIGEDGRLKTGGNTSDGERIVAAAVVLLLLQRKNFLERALHAACYLPDYRDGQTD